MEVATDIPGYRSRAVTDTTGIGSRIKRDPAIRAMAPQRDFRNNVFVRERSAMRFKRVLPILAAAPLLASSVRIYVSAHLRRQ